MKRFPSGYITKDMRRTVMKIFLLKKIQEKRTYTYSILKEIELEVKKSHHGGILPSGSAKNELYNTINSLQNAGYISMRAEVERNRVKKYYKITPKGRRALKEANVIFKRMVRDLQALMK